MIETGFARDGEHLAGDWAKYRSERDADKVA
jgi:hypothetical protein